MLYIVCAALLVLADQLFKAWIVTNIPLGGVRALIPGIIELTHLRNDAAAFSLFKGMQVPIIIATIVVCMTIIYLLAGKKIKRVWENVSLALILGGALGNLIDRLLNGYVVDMFQTQFIKFPIFNIADCGLTVGAIMFCVCIIFYEQGEKKTKKLSDISESEKEEVFEDLKKFNIDGEGNRNGPSDNGEGK